MSFMLDSFSLNLLLSFVVGGIWVTVTTFVAERFGSKLGGYIGSLPSTALISLFFIGLVQTPQVASQATTVMPLIFGLNALVLIVYSILAKNKFIIGLIGALSVWFILSMLIILFNVENFTLSLIISLLLFLFSYYILEKKLKIKSYGKLRINYTSLQIIWRAVFSGSIVAFAVLMSKIGGPIFGGVFSAFPAIITSTLIITYNSRGLGFSRAISKSFVVGTITVLAYVISVRYLYLTLDLITGTIVAYLISALAGYLAYTLISKRMK